MVWFKFLRNAEVDHFGTTLADRFSKQYPLRLQDDRRPSAQRKLEDAKNSMYSQVPAFRQRVPLGVLRRALLANTIKWALREKGYRDDVVDSVVRDLVFSLAKKKKG